MAEKITYRDGYYYGEVKNGEENGTGTFFWNDGDRYEGGWLNGEMHGYGVMYYANGDRYEGYWAHHVKHGEGVYYYADGDTRFGYWSHGNYNEFDDSDDTNGNVNGRRRSSDDDNGYWGSTSSQRQSARERLRRGTGVSMDSPEKTEQRSSSPRSVETPAKKQGKGKLIGKIILKSICCLFGLAIIALAVLQFLFPKADISEEERIATLVSQAMSGFFACGLWLFYYGTIVALKKAGVNVRQDLKDPSFWEIVSVTTVTTHYSDGSSEKKTYQNMRGSFFALIIKFLVIFGLVQIYYAIAAPVLAPISLIRDIKELKD